MVNVNKHASKVNKQLYQSEGETERSLKGKPRRKKQVREASIIPGPGRAETAIARNLLLRVTRPKSTSYAHGCHFSFKDKRHLDK